MAIRISGLASGIDTETMVKELMTAERMPLDKLTQQKTYLEWQRDDYRTVNRNLKSLSDKIFDGVMRQSTYLQKNVNVSNPDALSVRNIGSTSDFTGSISVSRLAKPATVIGTPSNDLNKTGPLIAEGEAAQEIKIRAIKADGTLQTEAEAYKFTIKPGETTLDSLIKEINSKSGVTMFYDSFTEKISATAKNSGNVADGKEMIFEGEFFTKMGLGTDDGYEEGINAEFTYNGLTTERSSNTFQLNGFEVTLKATTTNDTPVTFSSSPATDKIFDTIKTFVDDYNKLIEELNTQTNQRKMRDYPPLTDEQRKELSEDEVKLWDEQAKKGTLYRDSSIMSGLTSMRSNLYTPVAGLDGFSQLAEIGIKTTSNYLDKGKLEIDETKLKEAIAKDPNAIYQLFAADGSKTAVIPAGATDAEKKQLESAANGLGRRLRETIAGTIDKIEERAGKSTSVGATFTIGRTMQNLDSRIDSFETRLKQVEDRYWRQFTAMEKAIQQANSQSASLMNMFSNG